MELLAHYSNTPDLLTDLRRLVTTLSTPDDTHDNPGLPPHPSDRPWRVRDRLSQTDIQNILDQFRGGIPTHVLADRYSISQSSVKTLLRKHGVRRSNGRAAA